MNKKIIIGGLLLVAIVLVAVSIFKTSEASTKEEAIRTIVERYPELAIYQTDGIPPRSVEAKKVGNDWYVGFLQSGSGVQGILSAKCYRVDQKKEVVVIGTYDSPSSSPEILKAESLDLETCEPKYGEDFPRNEELQTYGNVTLKLGERYTFRNVSIQPLSVVEDSRCPADVQCIQAGTVKINTRIVSGLGTSTSVLTMGKVFTTKTEEITLISVSPGQISTDKILDNNYRFTFKVSPKVVTEKPVEKPATCYVGGCSSQLCSDDPGVVSTCEYREEYACYRTAKCERQSSGMCGWTQTEELKMCLLEKR
jgi:hypothetical protein